ncbi:MAG: MFS transporter [Chthoniobacterales bacterium]|nr:MFS transporter [Chthoniobacterales bacterium]
MPSLRRNIPLFVAFRVLFHARFYYPVIGVLFLDLGLNLEQYALLNVVWAVVIIVLEIPSGALADVIGRKRVVVLAAALMVAEMAVLAFAPRGTWMFWLLVLNRILSGAAEACASGADEALAYDSLPQADRRTAWPRVLESLMRWKSAGFFLAMITGAALFDSNFMSSVFGWAGWAPADGSTVRWPVYATLATSILCLVVALNFREPPTDTRGGRHAIGRAWQNVVEGAIRVFTSRRILFLMVASLLIDSFVRIFLTFASNYYRLIELPALVNGLLGSGLALLGFAVAPLAKRMVAHRGVVTNYAVVAVLVLTGLAGTAMALPYWGAWVVVPLGVAMSALQFFTSNYLNQWTESHVRATVLSFRGVAFNLGYAVAGILFAQLTAHLRAAHPGADENSIFAMSLPWLPAIFLGCGILLWLALRWTQKAGSNIPPVAGRD